MVVSEQLEGGIRETEGSSDTFISRKLRGSLIQLEPNSFATRKQTTQLQLPLNFPTLHHRAVRKIIGSSDCSSGRNRML